MRLYNEFGAAVGPHVKVLDTLLHDFSERVLNYAEGHGLDLRDCLGYIQFGIGQPFAERILIRAISLRKLKESSLTKA